MWTGHSKSYGLVEFEEQDLEKIRKIRDELDWKEVGSQVLHVDFVESSFQSWERLHSRCLFLSGLPKSFTEVSKLREMFSVVTSPVYCQVGLKVQSCKSGRKGRVQHLVFRNNSSLWGFCCTCICCLFVCFM